MRKLLFVLAATMFVLVSCDNYGKKIKINDTLEVYIKGDGVTENDARKLGDYFATLAADNKNDKSLQLSKDSGLYIVRMVVDQDKVKADSSLDVSFMALKTLFETEVFAGQHVKFIVTDNHFNDLKSYE